MVGERGFESPIPQERNPEPDAKLDEKSMVGERGFDSPTSRVPNQVLCQAEPLSDCERVLDSQDIQTARRLDRNLGTRGSGGFQKLLTGGILCLANYRCVSRLLLCRFRQKPLQHPRQRQWVIPLDRMPGALDLHVTSVGKGLRKLRRILIGQDVA